MDNKADKCIPQETVIEDVRLARAYVPFQKLCTTFTPSGALMKGTIFPPLFDDYRWGKKEVKVYEDE
ncbi:MAG: spore coat associated protein CotJA [Clostridiales bacterium]|nr:spore coat associated protein CotJA [Clostridiales bacterium]